METIVTEKFQSTVLDPFCELEFKINETIEYGNWVLRNSNDINLNSTYPVINLICLLHELKYTENVSTKRIQQILNTNVVMNDFTLLCIFVAINSSQFQFRH